MSNTSLSHKSSQPKINEIIQLREASQRETAGIDNGCGMYIRARSSLMDPTAGGPVDERDKTNIMEDIERRIKDGSMEFNATTVLSMFSA